LELILGGLLALAGTGCDSGSFVPPPPDNLVSKVTPAGDTVALAPQGSSSDAPAGRGVRPLEVILAPRTSQENELAIAGSRAQAGREKSLAKITTLDEQASPADQLAEVKAAIARDPKALVIEPADPGDEGLALAVRDARSRGIPVVIVGRPLQNKAAAAPVSEGGTATGQAVGPLVEVVPTPFEASARRLVSSAMRNATNGKLNPTAGAIILIGLPADPLVEERVAAIHKALEAETIAPIHEIRFDPRTENGKAKLSEALKAEPAIGMVFSVEYQGFQVAYLTVDTFIESRPYVVAGYTSDEKSSSLSRMGEAAALAEFSPTRLVRRAIKAAVAASNGDAPARIEFEVTVYDSEPTAGLPLYKSYQLHPERKTRVPGK
jgi:ABC-type sugar transport system substrate-binding protein